MNGLNDDIDEFLEKVHLIKYRERFLQNNFFKVTNVEDFHYFLENPEELKVIGLSVFEVARFKRVSSDIIQGILEKNEEIFIECGSEKRQQLYQQEVFTDSILGLESSKHRINHKLKLRYKCLTKEGVFCNNIHDVYINTSELYYELVDRIHKVLMKDITEMHISSVELFSYTGYPLASTPISFVMPISDLLLQINELIYVYPKRLITTYEFISNVDSEETVVNIQLRNGDLNLAFSFYNETILARELKTYICLHLHVPISCITIWCTQSGGREVTVEDKEIFENGTINGFKLSFTISDTYGKTDFLSSFHTGLYTSCVPHQFDNFHYFNAYLLYLVKEHCKLGNEDSLKHKLGLLRKISCSPPLVYALYLLFSGYTISLPHRVAINEGIITTVALLSTNITDKITYFPHLWLHIEEHASHEHSLSEIYEITVLSKATRENPMDDETRRLINVFPPTEDTVVTWRDSPSGHDAYSYRPASQLEEFSDRISIRFPIFNPTELYRKFLVDRLPYGLMRPLVPSLSSPLVFLGWSNCGFDNCSYFSPQDGSCHTFNPIQSITSNRMIIENPHKYPKIILILDISKDMGNKFTEKFHNYSNEKANTTKLFEVALAIIELFIDYLMGLEFKYLLGAMVVSNCHDFLDGFQEIVSPTFEYEFVFRRLQNFVDKTDPLEYPKLKHNKGIMTGALTKCMRKYPGNTDSLPTFIHLFTSGDTARKHDGVSANNFEKILKQNAHCCIINTVTINPSKNEFQLLSSVTNGIHVCTETLYEKVDAVIVRRFMTTDIITEFTCCSAIKMILQLAGLKQNYKTICNHFSQALSTSELFESVETTKIVDIEDRSLICNVHPFSIQILRQVTGYIKNPNPCCRIYSYSVSILKWLVLVRGSDDSLYKDVIWILELEFGEYYPQRPPKIHSLLPVFHPNVDLSGKICHPILYEKYHSKVTLNQIFHSLVDLISSPIIPYAVRYDVIETYLRNEKQFRKFADTKSDELFIPNEFSRIEHDLKIEFPILATYPSFLVCPLTKQLFKSPVTTPEGKTYEREAISSFLSLHKKDPFTNTSSSVDQLVPNHTVASVVYKYMKMHPEKKYWWEEK